MVMTTPKQARSVNSWRSEVEAQAFGLEKGLENHLRGPDRGAVDSLEDGTTEKEIKQVKD